MEKNSTKEMVHWMYRQCYNAWCMYVCRKWTINSRQKLILAENSDKKLMCRIKSSPCTKIPIKTPREFQKMTFGGPSPLRWIFDPCISRLSCGFGPFAMKQLCLGFESSCLNLPFVWMYDPKQKRYVGSKLSWITKFFTKQPTLWNMCGLLQYY